MHRRGRSNHLSLRNVKLLRISLNTAIQVLGKLRIAEAWACSHEDCGGAVWAGQASPQQVMEMRRLSNK